MKMTMLHEAARELAGRAERNLQHAEQLQRRPEISSNDKAEMLHRLIAMEHSIRQIRNLLEG